MPFESGEQFRRLLRVGKQWESIRVLRRGIKDNLSENFRDENILFYSSFVLQVTHVWQNSTRIEQPGLRPDGCFYHGTVRGDPHSVVSVNLCHGMTGHIRTSSGSFFIEPAEKWLENHTDSVIHRLYRIPSPPFMQEQHQPEPHCGLDETIHVDSDEANEEGEMSDRRRRRKRSSQENIIEMMIVADRKMAEYHGSGLNAYVLTLMHTLSKIFKDASIGNPISVALVKLYVLKDVELAKVLPNEKRGILASTMLRNFCDWQRKVNDVNDGSPNHHDAAMLLTREDICRTEKNCDTLGLAELGTMCSDSSCAIVQDNGLSAAFTMAHELGHVLNMLHDDDQKCIPFQGMSNRNHVMARMLDHNTIPWSWSYCSRHFLTEYLDAGYGDCLHDEPVKDIMTERGTRTTFPGENYTEDEQCALVFGRGSKICPYMSHCKRLWCTSNVESEGCRTQHMPWADGTPCGENHFKGWCQRGDCVPVQALDPIDGNWGEWQGWGPCSRSCGGGVKKSKRDCDDPSPSNGGKYCVGERERFRSCNTKDCPLNSQDFREEQCAQFNYNNFSIHGLTKDVQWIPKYSGIGSDDRCKLYCQVAHSTSYYLLRDKVVDGTPCEPDTFDICVNGVCIPSGCDHRLRSTTQLDYCGQCGGNNSSCQLVSGSYNSSQHGYSQVLRIPAGSSNLDIRQKGWNNSNKDDNYLALKDGETGGYILNGNYVVSMFRKLILYGSTTLEYSGSDADVERINSSRPLTKDLIIEVLSVGPLYPPDISYQYTIQYSSLAQYAWQISDEWSACNKVCNGERRKVIKCVRVEGRQEVAVEHCNGLNAPYTPVQSCNKHCDLKWQVISQSECSSHCGEGTRTLTVQCMQTFHDKSPASPIHNTSCSHIASKLVEPCLGPCDAAHWQYSDWAMCSKSCGTGIQRRAAECVDDTGNRVDSSLCQEREKIVERLCNTQKCPRWSVGDWSPCSVSCGTGERRRPYWCLQDNLSVDQNYCAPESVPHHKEVCNLEPCPEWITESWSQCSVSCGSGVKSRVVKCSSSMEDECTGSKPPTTESCFMQSCTFGHENAIPVINSLIHFSWQARDWSQCSVTCGGGLYKRHVYCFDQLKGREVNPLHCDGMEKPSPIGKCQEQPCPIWVMAEWSSCSASCGQGVETRVVRCMDDGRETDDSACSSNKPSVKRMCSHHCAIQHSPSKWRTGSWSECSVVCGGGFASRQVVCMRDNDILADNCDERKPVDKVPCNLHACVGAEWKFGPWSKCNQTCGGGYQHRQVQCRSLKRGTKMADKACPAHLRPANKQPCNTAACNRQLLYKWKALPWGPCSRTCGRGEHSRRVECVSVSTQLAVDESHCDASGHKKPKWLRTCKLGPCFVEWKAGEWSQCSHPCGKKGRQTRRLYCINTVDKRNVARRHCNRFQKPKRKRKCPEKSCGYLTCKDIQDTGARIDKEYTLNVAERNISIYCHNMNTVQPVEYLTLPARKRENFAEIYDCRFVPRYISNMKIDHFLHTEYSIYNVFVDCCAEKDWTFSYQVRGSRVAFGEAGDCYSRAKCPQGRFSINLSGTGLRVSPATEWKSMGPYSTQRITRIEGHRRVIGYCGGYCGSCSPINGLKLDVLPP
ncbi:LOW QUALITY PROTEIN: A disintegrin and metalloproteinase with thrombospondin motifs 9 [Nilaparvata lugens]|uniref:LOW QUALITY PROTEIN: A disintegrin and metalloproteinase with thrombospondin motifs 9 n=1 Tax=Nilaparvata lugens TaxID=108931 RepID=UPI00193DABDF|nr:LOW QUALITY PROTEIN: A disintegrin and metalloproteinase with thrombospondin motifs 9 [Nilaparvata lugens]